MTAAAAAVVAERTRLERPPARSPAGRESAINEPEEVVDGAVA